MDYEKEYKKLKGDIKKAHLFAQTDSTKAVLEDILPEPKESEDERIRKALLEHIKGITSWGYFLGISREQMIAWLEKQGEKDSQVILPMFTFDDILALQCCMKKVQKDEKLYNQLQTLHDRLHDAYWLEKQDEQKETCCDKCRREQPSHSCQDITELGRCALELQSKQKPTDKVEPKFKVGDFVVNKFGHTKLITNIENGCYYATNIDDNTEWHGSIEYANTHFYKWTIQDVKDGDVLCYEDEVFILKNYILFHKIVYHCCYDCKNFIPHSIYSLTKDDFSKVHPATKEQREQLEKAMADAGYEWNAEKKELKKIEQKPTDNLKWGELTWKDISTLEGIINNVHYEFRNGIGEEGFGEEVLERFREIKGDEYMDSCEQKSAWSEEDEWKFSDILALLRGGENYHYNTPELFAWLKSIKDRVQPQPKQEWSEEDEVMMNGVLNHLREYFVEKKGYPYVADEDSEEMKEMRWLKSLKPQFLQEFDEYTKEIITSVKTKIAMCNGFNREHREEIFKLIDKLKPQSHWKPSEEQMQILHKFSVPHAVVLEEDAKNLELLYDDLKQL